MTLISILTIDRLYDTLMPISIDDDNNYVLSNRNISEITKIDRF